MKSFRLGLLFLFFSIYAFNASALENCEWDNQKGNPCITISKTPNTSEYNSQGVMKKVFTKQDIINSGARDALDLLKKVSGLDYYQTGQKGQQGAVFMRGSESNHTLVLLNGIAINDQSVTNGMAEFGQDFLQTIQQVEVYKGSNGAHFGPDAIGGAINFVTDIDYKNNYSVNGWNANNLSTGYNTTKITDTGWHLNFNGAANTSRTDSAIAKGSEDDGTRNYQVNLNGNKWLNDNLKLKNTFYYRSTRSDYDSSATSEESITADNAMYALQSGVERKTQNSFDNFVLHYHNYDRKYTEKGKRNKYYSESVTAKAERDVKLNDKISYGFGSEYKYDWGSFKTTTYSSNTGGHVDNLGAFANLGYKFTDSQILSLHARNDHHYLTDSNQTYKINFTQIFDKYKFGITESTGLKNPSLYQFFGTGYKHKPNESIDAEESLTRELYAEYDYSDSISVNSTGYRTSMTNRIITGGSGATIGVVNTTANTTQEGIESEINWSGNNQSITLSSHFAKSRTATGGPNSRRPDVAYGIEYSRKFTLPEYGSFDLDLSHRFIGDHIDWTGSENSFVKSVDLVDMVVRKDWYGNILSINLTNLLNERYEKPATYSQDGRQISFGFRRAY